MIVATHHPVGLLFLLGILLGMVCIFSGRHGYNTLVVPGMATG
jgi:hypothetical protein